MRRSLPIASLALLAAVAAAAVPFWGAKTSEPAGTDPAALKPGQFIWEGDAVPRGPIVVVVSLSEQRAYVYRNGVRIGVSTVSTGKPGYRTPTGVFTVLQKDKDHHSKTYGNAPMPFSERLTWNGVALHAGGLPGYPSSHGCIHLPSQFARLLFQISATGMTVVVAEQQEAPEAVVHPAAIAPVDAATGQEIVVPRLGQGEDERWEPEKSPAGPVSILMSGADRRVLVYRNGIEIGRARLELRDPERPLGTHAYTMLEGEGEGPNPWIPGTPNPKWCEVGLPGYAGASARSPEAAEVERISVPPHFAKAIYQILAPGSTLLVTDEAVLEQTTGVPLTILTADPPPESAATPL
jgi:hypothetical protein